MNNEVVRFGLKFPPENMRTCVDRNFFFKLSWGAANIYKDIIMESLRQSLIITEVHVKCVYPRH
jgi:hypothetical protein